MYDFGVYLSLVPDEAEKAMLEQNIQMALQQQSITLEDAIDVREIHNLKLANQLLKVRRKKKAEQDQMQQQAMVQMQATANAESAERASAAEMQKQQALAETTLQIEQGKSQFEIQRMLKESEIKQQLADVQFQYDMQLAQLRANTEVTKETMRGDRDKQKEQEIENRKDTRAKIVGSQQSAMITQRENNDMPIDFEADSNNTMDLMGSMMGS